MSEPIEQTDEPTPDEEPEPTPTPSDEPDEEEEAEQTSAQAAAKEGSANILKAAGTATRNYHKRIEQILGPDPNRHECPACEGKGVVWGELEETPEPVHPENLVTCETCNGYGEVLTGSRHPNHITAMCVACAGNGFITKPIQPANVTPITPTPAPQAQPQMGYMNPDGSFTPFGVNTPALVPQTS